jgi:hypothetical protein
MSLLEYIRELVGTPYVWWQEGSTLTNTQPFYANHEPVPSVDKIKCLGMNCAGFINLLCRKAGTPIPGVDENNYYAGGTYVWYESLNARGKLQPIDDQQIYPIGTLLLAEYIDTENQGHVAVVTTPGTIHTLKISHSWPANGLVMDEPVSLTHGLVETGYYTSVAKTEDWLMQPLSQIPQVTMV